LDKKLFEASPDTVFRDDMSIDKPFLIAKAVGVKRGAYQSKASFIKKYGEDQVRSGPVPYASTYSMSGNVTSLASFVQMHMGACQSATRYPPFDGRVTHAAANKFEQLLSAFPNMFHKRDAPLKQLIVGCLERCLIFKAPPSTCCWWA
jgi:hypothetical protein